MPRKSEGARLVVDKRNGKLLIQDGQTRRGTGCYESDRATAERKLAEYIQEREISKHNPANAIDKGNPNAAKIADVLALEMQFFANATMPDSRKKEFITVCENMGKWFGNRVVGDLDGEIQQRYACERKRYVMRKVDGKRIAVATDQPAPIAAYRDLKILAAAVNRYLSMKIGGVQTKFVPVLPEGPVSRVRWLERSEAARMIWAAWRKRSDGVYTSRHIARFILVSLYTGGSRKGDVCGAALMPTVGRGFVDLDRGIFKRKAENKKATNKRQPTIPIPPGLLAHLRRWHRLGISRQAVVEFRGKPVVNIKVGFDRVVMAAGLATDVKEQKVIPHTLRHTSITWLLRDGVDIELVSQYSGVSVEAIRKTYRHEMPGQHDPVLKATRTFGRVNLTHNLTRKK
jgi:integrase